MKKRLRRLGEQMALVLRAVRAPFLVVTVIPVMLGAAVATVKCHQLDPGLFLLSLLGCLALHAGANAANEYYDWQSGADAVHAPWRFNGGSQVLQAGLMSPRRVRRIYRSSYMLALALGGYVALRVGPLALLIGLAGLALGHWYTAPPVAFCYRGLGELVTGITFGPLVVTGSYFVQTGNLDWLPVLVSLPVGLLITAVLYINEFPDYPFDKASGKSNWVVRTGGRCLWIHQALIMAAVGLTLYTLLQVGPWFALAALPLAWLAGRTLWPDRRLAPEVLTPMQSGTLKLHACTGLMLTGAYLLAGLR